MSSTPRTSSSPAGARARRQEHGRRVDRPHRAPRQARQIRGRLLPQRARPHDQITKEKGAAGSGGAVSAGNQPPMLPKNSAHTEVVTFSWTSRPGGEPPYGEVQQRAA